MAKSPRGKETEFQSQIANLAGSVHTYESFGRAVVAAALQQAASASTDGQFSSTTVIVDVKPIGSRTFLDEKVSAGNAAHGRGAIGHLPPITISICVGSQCLTL